MNKKLLQLKEFVEGRREAYKQELDGLSALYAKQPSEELRMQISLYAEQIALLDEIYSIIMD